MDSRKNYQTFRRWFAILLLDEKPGQQLFYVRYLTRASGTTPGFTASFLAKNVME